METVWLMLWIVSVTLVFFGYVLIMFRVWLDDDSDPATETDTSPFPW